ncbi:hypothetical protein C1646_821546 [Rhizophagus diaphanus]|nr:hypothetical protein C1646_821546 [Rhizophagus diaphanus] [Rhizophagus sp. MUCL 43196]
MQIFNTYNTYSSRLLSYNNLPEPKNSNDYYEQNDNIISMFSAPPSNSRLNTNNRSSNSQKFCQLVVN